MPLLIDSRAPTARPIGGSPTAGKQFKYFYINQIRVDRKKKLIIPLYICIFYAKRNQSKNVIAHAITIYLSIMSFMFKVVCLSCCYLEYRLGFSPLLGQTQTLQMIAYKFHEVGGRHSCITVLPFHLICRHQHWCEQVHVVRHVYMTLQMKDTFLTCHICLTVNAWTITPAPTCVRPRECPHGLVPTQAPLHQLGLTPSHPLECLCAHPCALARPRPCRCTLALTRARVPPCPG